MLGVVLWSDKKDRKAVFWCEDHLDLAFYDGCSESDTQTGFTSTNFISTSFFEAGDMVRFDVTLDGKMRKALNAYVVEPQSWIDVPDELMGFAQKQPVIAPYTRTVARILPFRPLAEGDTRKGQD